METLWKGNFVSIIVGSFFLIVHIFLDCRNRNRFLGENVIGTKERGDSSCETKKEDEFQARRFYLECAMAHCKGNWDRHSCLELESCFDDRGKRDFSN